MMRTRQTGMSARDLKLAVGFAFFVELIACYMLLIDGPLSQMGKVSKQLADTTLANTAIKEAGGNRSAAREKSQSASPLPAPIERKSGESPSIAIQRHMEGMTTLCKLTPLSLTIPPPTSPAPEDTAAAAVPTYRVTIKVRGSFAAVSEFIGWIGQPEYQSGIDQIVISSQAEQPESLEAEVHMSFYLVEQAHLRKG